MTSGAAFVDLLVGQVSSPVRWDLCMESFAAPASPASSRCAGGTLVGLAKRALKGVPTVAVKTPTTCPPPSSSSSRPPEPGGQTEKAEHDPHLQQSHGPAYTRIYAVGAARGEIACRTTT